MVSGMQEQVALHFRKCRTTVKKCRTIRELKIKTLLLTYETASTEELN